MSLTQNLFIITMMTMQLLNNKHKTNKKQSLIKNKQKKVYINVVKEHLIMYY